MATLHTLLGYTAAGLTLAVLASTPLALPALTQLLGRTGVEVDPTYTGGPLARTVERGAWRLEVHQPVRSKAPMPSVGPFVQLDFRPASALPPVVDEAVDLDGDGAPDVSVRFEVPADPKAKLLVEVVPRSPGVTRLSQGSPSSLSGLIVRLADAIVVRVPLERP